MEDVFVWGKNTLVKLSPYFFGGKLLVSQPATSSCALPPQAGLLRTTPVAHAKQPQAQKTQQIQISKLALTEAAKMAIATGSYEEDPCVICHEDMNASIDIVTLECGHRYHSPVSSFSLCRYYFPYYFSCGFITMNNDFFFLYHDSNAFQSESLNSVSSLKLI